jgi:peptidoglycan L-alanyl-D-glutamate endopeptidase CwlK
MTWRFSRRSYARLVGVRPELIAVATRALLLSPVDFGISEGLRSAARQAELIRSGASQTHRSRHLTGHAIDVVAYVGDEVRWDWPLYDAIAKAMKLAALDLGIPIEWGGDWATLKDGPHYQLPWQEYPA